MQSDVIAALAQAYDTLSRDELAAYADETLARFRNPALRDAVTRVARDPIRKLSANDRLLASFYLALRAGHEPWGLVQAIAAACRYDYAGDAEATALQERIARDGLRATIAAISGLTEDRWVRAVEEAWTAWSRGSTTEVHPIT